MSDYLDERVHAVHGRERRTLCGIGPWTADEAPHVRIRFVVLGVGRDDRVTCATCQSLAVLGDDQQGQKNEPTGGEQ